MNAKLEGSVQNSLHLTGDAIDLRANEDGLRFAEDFKKDPDKFPGVKKVIVHGKGANRHVHVELKEVSLNKAENSNVLKTEAINSNNKEEVSYVLKTDQQKQDDINNFFFKKAGNIDTVPEAVNKIKDEKESASTVIDEKYVLETDKKIREGTADSYNFLKDIMLQKYEEVSSIPEKEKVLLKKAIKNIEKSKTIGSIIFDKAAASEVAVDNAVKNTAKSIGRGLDNAYNGTKEMAKTAYGYGMKILVENGVIVDPTVIDIAVEKVDWKKEQEESINRMHNGFNEIQEQTEKIRVEKRSNKLKKYIEEGFSYDDNGYSNKAHGNTYRGGVTFDNEKGAIYGTTPRARNFKNTNVKGKAVAHFLLSADLSGDKVWRNKNTTSALNKQMKGKAINPYSTAIPYIQIVKHIGNGDVSIKYKKPEEITENDKIGVPMRQFRFSDFVWNKGAPSLPFGNASKYIHGIAYKKKDKRGNLVGSDIIFNKRATHEKSIETIGDSAGLSVVFIYEVDGKRYFTDYTNSAGAIHRKGRKIINDFNIKDEDLTIGMYDAGSYTAKPLSKNGVLKFKPSYFNPKRDSGASLYYK